MANSKLKLITSAALPLLMFFHSSEIFSKEWTPENPTDIILTYDKDFVSAQDESQGPIDAQSTLSKVEQLIKSAKLPGNSQNLMTAKQWLAKIDSQGLNTQQKDRYYLAQANIAQSQHDFEQSLTLLNNIGQSSLYFPQSLLVAARVYIIQNQLDAAEQQCRQLISYNLPASELCLIEVKVHQGELSTAKQSIQRLAKRYQEQSSPLSQYFHQISGTLYRIEKDYQRAQASFANNLAQAPVSQWYRWTDMAFQNSDTKTVYQAIHELEQSHSSIEDGLLIRLARAEQANNSGNKYQSLAKDRVQLRQLRKDDLHAADIAYYYTYVSPDSELASQWAQKNWKHVKEPADKELLLQAQSLDD